MSIVFKHKGLTYGSIPNLPILEGSHVLVVSTSVGRVSQNMHYLRSIGQVKHLYAPGTAMHHWWRYKHAENYIVPRKSDSLFVVEFLDGQQGLFTVKNLVHVAWLSTDILPSSYPSKVNLSAVRARS
jgi:hypothetical protein